MLLGEPLGRELLLLAQRPHELLAHDVLDLPTDHGHVRLGVDHDLHHRSGAGGVQLDGPVDLHRRTTERGLHRAMPGALDVSMRPRVHLVDLDRLADEPAGSGRDLGG
jgi:hypothetical protein